MSIQYRPAGNTDFETLAWMRIAMLREEGELPDELLRIIHENTVQFLREGHADGTVVFCVAEEAGSGGAIVAMCGLSIYRVPPDNRCVGGKTAYAGNMYTRPEWRGRGMASRLLALLVEEGIRRGCERVLLDATDLGRPIYEKKRVRAVPADNGVLPKKKSK